MDCAKRRAIEYCSSLIDCVCNLRFPSSADSRFKYEPQCPVPDD